MFFSTSAEDMLEHPVVDFVMGEEAEDDENPKPDHMQNFHKGAPFLFY